MSGRSRPGGVAAREHRRQRTPRQGALLPTGNVVRADLHRVAGYTLANFCPEPEAGELAVVPRDVGQAAASAVMGAL